MGDTRYALVTGASRGIGRAVAIRLARQGYGIAACYREESDASETLRKELAGLGVESHLAPCDVADPGAVDGFAAEAEKRLGPIHALVNNAGITRDAPLVLTRREDWDAVRATNLDGTWAFCRAMAFRFMKRRSGVIVNLSSVAGVYGNSGQTSYAASKAGIIGLSLSLAKEVAPYGIRVNVVAPGFIETDMTGALDEKTRLKARELIALKRYGTAGEVAEVVEFLVSGRASYITGQVIQVDGGISL